MDANNTRYHAFITRADWAQCYGDPHHTHVPRTKAKVAGSQVLPEGTGWYSNALTLAPLTYEHKAAPNDTAPEPQDRRGAARDRFGNVYWIDAARTAIRMFGSGAKTAVHYWRAGDSVACDVPNDSDEFAPSSTPAPPAIQELSGLAVTDDHYLVVGVVQPVAGLLIFDLQSGGAPSFMPWPKDAAFAPSDLAARPGNGVWILDVVMDEHARLWALDGRWQVIALGAAPNSSAPGDADDFAPLLGNVSNISQQPMLIPQQFVTSAAHAFEGFTPIAIAGLPDCSVLLLDNESGDKGLGRVRRLSVEQGVVQTSEPAALKFPAYAFEFVSEHKDAYDVVQPDQLFVVLQQGNQALSYDISLNTGGLVVTDTNKYWPMRLFGGRGLLAGKDTAYYDSAQGLGVRWLPLVAMNKAKHVSTATFYTPVLDGREPDCVWHRLLLDGCLPPETEVRVRSRATNDLNDWPKTWDNEPALYLRGDGSELPFVARQHRDARAGNGTWELLIQQARGQFIQLEITLAGDGRVTPQVRALRIYYPRFSYRDRYLPAIYRDPELIDAGRDSIPNQQMAAATFLDRFMANFEGVFTAIEDRIAAAQVLLDARSAPADALAWLADWLGVVLDPTWNERTRRLFIQHALHFFQYRGTRHGLSMALRLALDDDACLGPTVFEFEQTGSNLSTRYRITEKFSTRTQTTIDEVRAAAHQFVVSLPVTASGQANLQDTQRKLALARRVIALEKPAHTDFTVQLYWALFQVGQARLGEDSVIGLGSRSPELMKPAVLGQSYLVESYIAGAISGVRA